MKPIAYLMVERNNQTTYFQTSIPTREEKISHHPIPLYTKEEDIECQYCENGKTAYNYEVLTNSTNKLTDKELIIFLMDEIDTASRWLVEGQTHMATGVLGQCHAEIRKHLSK